MINHSNHIDAVITWVDGNDLNHQKTRLKAYNKISNTKKNVLLTSFDKTRFLDNGELKYCIASIRKFAPWIHKIHLITGNQVPAFLNGKDTQKRNNINIVDHKEIFKGYEWALPTFNSRTIETALWRIPGLAPRFIYLNDDFIITNPVTPEDFFNNGKVILRGGWKSISEYGTFRLKLNNLVSYAAKNMFGITRSMNLLLQIRSAKLAGFSNRYFRVPHVPHPIITETLRKYYDEDPFTFQENIKYRFRNTDQISSIYLANHLEIKNNNAILREADDTLMINGEMNFSPLIKRKIRKIEENKVRFICLQGFEKFSSYHRKNIENTLSILVAE